MPNSMKFLLVGTTFLNDSYVAHFIEKGKRKAEEARLKTEGHIRVKLIDLPEAMTQADAAKWACENDPAFNVQKKAAMLAAAGLPVPEVAAPKETAPKAPKEAKAAKPSKAKVTAPKVVKKTDEEVKAEDDARKEKAERLQKMREAGKNRKEELTPEKTKELKAAAMKEFSISHDPVKEVNPFDIDVKLDDSDIPEIGKRGIRAPKIEKKGD